MENTHHRLFKNHITFRIFQIYYIFIRGSSNDAFFNTCRMRSKEFTVEMRQYWAHRHSKYTGRYWKMSCNTRSMHFFFIYFDPSDCFSVDFSIGKAALELQNYWKYRSAMFPLKYFVNESLNVFFFGEMWYVWSVLQYLKIKYRIVLNAHSWQKKVSLIILTNQIIFLFKIFKQLFKFIITIKNCRMFNQITKQSIHRQPLKHSLHKQTKRFFIPKNRPKNPNKKPMYVQKPGKRSTIMMEC